MRNPDTVSMNELQFCIPVECSTHFKTSYIFISGAAYNMLNKHRYVAIMAWWEQGHGLGSGVYCRVSGCQARVALYVGSGRTTKIVCTNTEIISRACCVQEGGAIRGTWNPHITCCALTHMTTLVRCNTSGLKTKCT